jgi:hypothetical protein
MAALLLLQTSSVSLLGDRFGFIPRAPNNGNATVTNSSGTVEDVYHGEGPPSQSSADNALVNGMALAGVALALLGTWAECSSDPNWAGVHAWWHGASRRAAALGDDKDDKLARSLEQKRDWYRVGLRFLRWVVALFIFAEFALYTRIAVPADEFDLGTIAGGFHCSAMPPAKLASFSSVKCIRFKDLDIISFFEGAGLGHSVGALLRHFVTFSIRIFVRNGWVNGGARAYTAIGIVLFVMSIVEIASFNVSVALVYVCSQCHFFAAAFMMRNGDHDADGFADGSGSSEGGDGEGQGVELMAVQGSSSSPISSARESNVAKHRAARHSTVCDVDVV